MGVCIAEQAYFGGLLDIETPRSFNLGDEKWPKCW